MIVRVLILSGVALTLAAPALRAEIVAQPQLAQFCIGQAAERLGTRPAGLMTLPVERNHGIFTVYGQTDSADPVLFSCTFDSAGRFLELEVQEPHDHGDHATGQHQAGVGKCLQMVGVPAAVEQVSALRPGFAEVIIKEQDSPRRVACTVRDDGSQIEDWVEMN